MAFLNGRPGALAQIALITAATWFLPPAALWSPLVVLALAAALAWLAGDDLHRLGLGWPAGPWAAWLAEGVLVGALWQLIAFGLLTPGLNTFFGLANAAPQHAGDWGYYLSGVLAYGIWQPLAKGFVYRTFLLKRLETLLGSGPLGLVLSGLLAAAVFGLASPQPTAVGMLLVTLAGAVFNLVYYALRRNLWPSVLAHAAYNLAAFTLIFLGLL